MNLTRRFRFTDTRCIAAVVGLLLGSVVWLASVTGLFTVANGVLFDYLSVRMPSLAHKPPKVLLLDVEPEFRDAGDDRWLPLLRELQTLGATQVVFAFMPSGVSRDFYHFAQQTGKVIFGRRLVAPAGAQTLELERPPTPAQGLDLVAAVNGIAASDYGVYRRQAYVFVGASQQPVFSLEAVAAGRAPGSAAVDPGHAAYLVNFMGTTGLPRIAVSRALKGELIPELVSGRTVLIGASSSGPALFTPLAASGQLLTDLEFHGYALDTLLSDKRIWPVPLWLEFALLLLVIGVSLFVFQWGGLKFSAGWTATMVVVYALLAWAALNLVRVWLPLGELWVAQIATFLVFTRYRAVSAETKLRNILLNTNFQLRQRFFPPSFASSPEHWSQVITMVNQTLNLERVIFLERVKGDHRLREVTSLNCSLQDIKEQRRDYERVPYSTAIAAGHPIEVDGYLTRGEEGEVQRLVPLMFGGEVQGFWAFGARPEKLSALHNRDAVLRDFAEQIAELLFHRQQALDKEARRARPLQRYLRLQGGEQVAEALEKTLTALDRRLLGMEDYLDGLSTAGMLYDLFGRVLIVNRKMVHLLTQAQLAPYQLTAIDLISVLGGVKLDYARSLMQSIILDRQNISLPVTLMDGARSYVLYLGPLLPAREKQILHDGDPVPFEVAGVLCELIDITAIKHLFGLKDEMVERVTYQVRNDTESLLAGITLLETAGLPDEKRGRVLSIIRDKVNQLVAVSQQVTGLLNVEIDAGAMERYPIDCLQPLRAAVEAVRAKAAAHGIGFDLQLPELVSLVFASPDGLKPALESIVDLLVTDSVQQGRIQVTVEERDGWIVYRFTNQGFGMPEERFHTYLHGDAPVATEEFKKLRKSALRVVHWGGELQGHSEVGVGTRFELRLKGFI